MAAMFITAAHKARIVLKPNPDQPADPDQIKFTPALAADWAPGRLPPDDDQQSEDSDPPDA
jgi:hypothetical protein